MRTSDLSRRRFLRGSFAGAVVSIGLPRLSALLDSHGQAWAAGGGRPIRYITWGFGNGVVTTRWNPKTTGQGNAWQLSESFMPLAQWKPYMTAITGVNVVGAGAHGTGNIVYLSGAGCVRNKGPFVATLDQQIAAVTKAQTSIKSLEVALTDNQDDRTLGHLYWSHNGPGSPNPPSYKPKEVFDRLFGPNSPGSKLGTGANAPAEDPAATKAAENIRTMRKSVLDFVKDDAARLRTALPATDKLRLDQHLEGVREVEKGILSGGLVPGGASAGCRAPAAAGFTINTTATGFNPANEINNQMSKLVALALACDLTRVVTYQTTQAASRANWPDLGISNWHGTSHDGSAGGQEKIQKVIMHHMGWLKTLVTELSNTPDGAGTLLDNLALLTVNEIGQGFTHQSHEMPSLIIGKAGGSLKGDVSMRLDGWCGRVCLSVAHAVGVKLDRFGYGERIETNPISEIFA